MQKILFLFVAATISITAMSQGNSKGKENGHGKPDKNYNNRNGDDGRYERKNNDDERYENKNERNNNSGWNNRDQSGKYSKNTPSKVGNSFYRDYPNAGNVSWTKSQGVWTAHFGNGLFNRTASYRANGQRVGFNSNNRTGLDKILRRGGIGGN